LPTPPGTPVRCSSGFFGLHDMIRQSDPLLPFCVILLIPPSPSKRLISSVVCCLWVVRRPHSLPPPVSVQPRTSCLSGPLITLGRDRAQQTHPPHMESSRVWTFGNRDPFAVLFFYLPTGYGSIHGHVEQTFPHLDFFHFSRSPFPGVGAAPVPSFPPQLHPSRFNFPFSTRF